MQDLELSKSYVLWQSPLFFQKNSISTHSVEGLLGKFRTNILGFGKELVIADSSSKKKSISSPIGICLMSAPAITNP